MNELIAVHAPAARLAEVEGVEVLLLSVELWRNGIFVHLAGRESELTDRLLRQHKALMDRWGRDPNPTEVPEQPGEILGRMPLTIADDIGTGYFPHSRSTGGTGTEWRADWQFEPGVPAGASRLTVAIGTDRLELVL